MIEDEDPTSVSGVRCAVSFSGDAANEYSIRLNNIILSDTIAAKYMLCL
jgi:hypothetical protein